MADAHAAARDLMQAEAERQGFAILREDMLSYHAGKGVFAYRVLSTRDVNQRYGATTLYMKDGSNVFVALSLPTGDSAAKTFTTWIRSLHQAAIGGLPMQIAVSVVGLMVVLLSGTGILVFLRKRTVRSMRRRS